MNYKSLNSAIRSVTNPQPKNKALNSLQENIDLFNAVHPYTVGLQSVIVLVMLEALLDGSGPISGTVSLFKNLMKKWKARVLGGKLSADEGQSFIEEYEKLSASLPTGKRNFLKASLNKMEQAAKAGDKSKLGAIATEVKNYLARNSSEVKEEQTAQLSPDLTRTILSVVKEGQAYSGDPPYSGVERRAKSGPNQRATKGSSRTEYNHSEGEYRPSGEQDRYYAKQRAEAKAKKTTTVKEERVGLINLKRKP